MIGAINIEYENIEFENGEIEKQSGELKASAPQSEILLQPNKREGIRTESHHMYSK